MQIKQVGCYFLFMNLCAKGDVLPKQCLANLRPCQVGVYINLTCGQINW